MDSPFKELVVVTYNIRHGRGRDDVQDIDRTRLVLEQADAQLIGLQEVDCCNPWRSHNVDQSAYLASSLSMQHHFAPARTEPAPFGNTVLSRYPVLKTDVIHLPRKGTAEDRSAAVAEVLIDDEHLTFVSVHLGLSGEERLEHAAIIVDYLTQKDGPIILVGDLNEQPGGAAYQKISAVFADAAAQCGREHPTFPYHSPTGEANVRIDYVFISSGLEAVFAEAVPVWASDHLPVRAVLRLTKKGG